jgi:hypothetical protein
MNDAERAIERAGFGPQFRDAADGVPGDRECLAYMFLAGLGAHAVSVGKHIKTMQAKLPAHMRKASEVGS